MQNIVAKIQVLYSALVVKDAEVNQQKKRLMDGLSQVKEDKDKLEAYAKGLAVREATVSEIESVKQLSEDVAEGQKKLAFDVGELSIQRTAFESTQTRVAQENKKTRDDLAIAIASNKAQADELKKQLAELAERKKTLKEEVVKELIASSKN